jgi:hypothetical protein
MHGSIVCDMTALDWTEVRHLVVYRETAEASILKKLNKRYFTGGWHNSRREHDRSRSFHSSTRERRVFFHSGLATRYKRSVEA